jgi:hypothetical protein
MILSVYIFRGNYNRYGKRVDPVKPIHEVLKTLEGEDEVYRTRLMRDEQCYSVLPLLSARIGVVDEKR